MKLLSEIYWECDGFFSLKTRTQCGFYYYGLGNEATKQLGLPRWLASNQSYDSWSIAPCCTFPFGGERCKYVSIKVSLFLSLEESCLDLNCHWLMLFLSFPDQTPYLIQQGLNMSTTIHSTNKISHGNVTLPWALCTIHLLLQESNPSSFCMIISPLVI